MHRDLSIDPKGTEVVKYVYDPWGRILSTTGSLASTLGTHQPFRYRGYVYDVETGFYYLRSRYYNPVWQRFISADVIMKGNLFNYCANCPLLLYDPNGKDFLLSQQFGFLIEKDIVRRSMLEARKKYNAETVHVYTEGEDDYREGKLNVMFYQSGRYINIHIGDSTTVRNEYEMEAIIEVIEQHPAFDSKLYGSHAHMRAQWIAHNTAYDYSTGSQVQKVLISLLARNSVENIKGSSQELDFRPYGNFTKSQLLYYSLIETICCSILDY